MIKGFSDWKFKNSQSEFLESNNNEDTTNQIYKMQVKHCFKEIFDVKNYVGEE